MFKLCTAALLGTALVSGAANAVVNLEYGMEYEEAYMLSCTRDHSPRACSCSMVALEEKVGFTRFAEEVDRHRDAFLEESDLAVMATDLVAQCKAISGLTED
jgi:hypothetical protein